MSFRKEMPFGPSKTEIVIQLKLHGGVGDYLWVLKKLVNCKYPLFIHISSEGRHRPHRSGIIVDHSPNVIGWRYDSTTFCPWNGQDWTAGHEDPACALGKTWKELEPLAITSPLRLECNRHLEAGKMLADWLPDLPTTHHFKFEAVPPSTVATRRPCVVLHLAGWGDVPDDSWATIVDLFRPLAHIYIIGGSYDHRPRAVYNQVCRGGRVTLLEDVSFADLVGVLSAADYCFGHASGLTALADVLSVPGAVVYPRYLNRMVGTWNDPDDPKQVHVATAVEFEQVVFDAYRTMSSGGSATWPPTAVRGSAVFVSKNASPTDIVSAAMSAVDCRRLAVYVVGDSPPSGMAAAMLSGAYNSGKYIVSQLIVNGTADMYSAALNESSRCSHRPVIDLVAGSWPSHDHETYDMVTVWVGDDPAQAVESLRMVWSHITPRGMVLVGGKQAKAAIESLGAALKAKPAEVQNGPGWFYLHRRV